MSTAKEKCRVSITLRDNLLLKGYVYINQGERVFEFINDPREAFIPVIDVEICSTQENGSYVSPPRLIEKKDSIIVIKSAILWIEEVQ